MSFTRFFLALFYCLLATTPFTHAAEKSMDTVYDLRLLAEAAGDVFGYSTEIAGDVNGDGYQDVIIGASGNDTAGSGAGAAYIYFGGASMDTTADVTLRGVNAGDNFGNTATTAGDVNNDGFHDVIVGANGEDTAGSSAGAAYIYFGGASMDSTADITLTGHTAGDQFGYGLSSAGDINGDGYDDVIVGAYGNDVGGSNAGRAYLFYGGASMDSTPDTTFTGEAAGDQFGVSMNPLGDVNGDTYPDIIVGANNNDRGGSNAGAAFIFYGNGDSIDTTVDVVLVGEAASDGFSGNPPAAGDVNNDGYADVLVGADGNDSNGSVSGESYLYYGGASMDSTADLIYTGAATNYGVGNRNGIIDDINGDGYREVMIGAPVFSTSTGAVYILYGGPNMDNVADITFTGPATNTRYANGFTPFIGDLNGDGLSDIVIGAEQDDTVGSNAGAAYVYFGTGSLQNDGTGQSSGSGDGGNGGGGSDASEPEAFPPVTLVHTNKRISNQPFTLKVQTSRTDAKKIYAVIHGKTYPLYDDGKHGDGKKKDLVYATNPLTLSLSKTTPYAVYAEYASTKTKSVGTLEPAARTLSPSLTSQIASVFAQVYGRPIALSEKTYWTTRVTRGDKTSLGALIGAMQFQKLFK